MKHHNFSTRSKLLPTLLLMILIVFPLEARSQTNFSEGMAPILQVSTGQTTPTIQYVPGEVLVKFSTSISGSVDANRSNSESLNARLQNAGVTDISPLFSSLDYTLYSFAPELTQYYKLNVPEDADIIALSEQLIRDPGILLAAPNVILNPALVPNDTYFEQQWALNNNAFATLNFPNAWDITIGTSNVIIAVLDSGFDVIHPDLNSKNTYTGYDFFNDDFGIQDDFGHGTAVSGIIAANSNNGQGVTGAAWNARIMPVKVCGNGSSPSQKCSTQAIWDGIVWAINPSRRANIINMSLGGMTTGPGLIMWQDIVDQANAAGVVLVASAGNDREFLDPSDTVYYAPAELNHVITVGAINQNNEDCRPNILNVAANCEWDIWGAGGVFGGSAGTGYGPALDVMAPGSANIWTTQLGGGYAQYFSGTSAAAPFVSGLAALMLSVNPSLTPEQIENLIKENAFPLDLYAESHPNWSFGWGRIDAHASVLAAQGTNCATLTLAVQGSGSVSTFPSSSLGCSLRQFYPGTTITLMATPSPGWTFSHWEGALGSSSTNYTVNGPATITAVFTSSPGSVAVSNLNNSGPGSLRQAILDASSGDTIQFAVTGTINLSSALNIDKSLTIEGPSGDGIIIDINANDVGIADGVTVSLKWLTVRGAFPNYGGQIYNAGHLIVNDSTFIGTSISNLSGYDSTLDVVNSTFSEAMRCYYGCGVILNQGTARLSFVTIIGSSYGITNYADMYVKNSIILGGNDACQLNVGTFTAVGNNLASDDSCFGFTIANAYALLDDFANYGGSTATYRIAGQPHASPALNIASDCTDHNGNPVPFDQRGQPRPGLSSCDLGAFEYQFSDSPRVHTITTLADSGAGSLRQAVQDAWHGDTIQFGVQGTISLASALNFDRNVFLEGLYDGDGIVIDINASDVGIAGGVTISLNRLTIRGTFPNYGGQMYNAGHLIVNNSTFVGTSISNLSGYDSTLDVVNSTFSEAMRCYYGCGVIMNQGTARLSFVTITGSSYGITNFATMQVKNSIILGGNDACQLVDGTFTAVGNNLASDDSCSGFTIPSAYPLLDDLADYGGATATYRIAGQPYASPALNAVTDCTDIGGNSVSFDQRGQSRPSISSTSCDLGAFEYQFSDSPRVHTITTLADSGAGSLRQAAQDAWHGDTIQFGVRGTISLASALNFDRNVFLEGASDGDGIVIDINASDVGIAGGVTVSLKRLTIRGTFPNYGGQLYNAGHLIVNDSTFVGTSISNLSGYDSTLDVVNSTFSEAMRCYYGCGVILNQGTARLSFVTITGSSYGITNYATMQVKNSIILGSNDACQLVDGTFTSVGNNFASDDSCSGITLSNLDASLSPLSNNGGTTATFALLQSSPAFNAASNCTDLDGNTLTTDQRGAPRPSGAACDLGAFELTYIADVSLQLTFQGKPAAPNSQLIDTLHIVLKDSATNTVVFDEFVTTNEMGTLVIPGITPGMYRIRVKGSHSLAVAQNVTLVLGENNLTLGTLREGDANGDNGVNLIDFSLLAASFGKASAQPGYDARTDFNDDGQVNLIDFSLLASNFGQAGAAP